jgi:hypothetical protein
MVWQTEFASFYQFYRFFFQVNHQTLPITSCIGENSNKGDASSSRLAFDLKSMKFCINSMSNAIFWTVFFKEFVLQEINTSILKIRSQPEV